MNRWITTTYVLALVALGAWLLVTRWDTISELSDGGSPALLGVVGGLAFLPPLVSSAYWRIALAESGIDTHYLTIVQATARSLLSRYLPGGIWYAASRVVLLGSAGVPATTGGLVAATELAMTIFVALAIGAPVVAVGTGQTTLAIVLIAAALTGLAIGRPLVTWLARRLSKGEAVPDLAISTYLRLIGTTAVFWATLTTVFVLYMRAVGVAGDVDALMLAGGYALAWVVGWLAPFAPQGIGVFEAALAAILGDGDLADLAIMLVGFRALLLMRDLVATLIGVAIPERPGRPK